MKSDLFDTRVRCEPVQVAERILDRVFKLYFLVVFLRPLLRLFIQANSISKYKMLREPVRNLATVILCDMYFA